MVKLNILVYDKILDWLQARCKVHTYFFVKKTRIYLVLLTLYVLKRTFHILFESDEKNQRKAITILVVFILNLIVFRKEEIQYKQHEL